MRIALSVVRDVLIIVAIIAVGSIYAVDRFAREQDRAVRLMKINRIVKTLDEAYKGAVYDSPENKGIYQQIFRQNEILIEYQKLLLTSDLLPITDSDRRDAWAPPTPPAK